MPSGAWGFNSPLAHPRNRPLTCTNGQGLCHARSSGNILGNTGCRSDPSRCTTRGHALLFLGGRLMATIVERRRRDGVAFQVRWRQDGAWQSDTFGTKRQALRFQCDVEDAGNRWPTGWVPGYGYQAAPPDVSAETSFAEVAERYLLTRTSVSSYQLARYRSMVARLAERFPVIADVDDESIAHWVRDCQETGVAAKTIANYHGLLHGICAHAVRKGLLSANPCALTRLPKVRSYDAQGEPIACFLEPAEFVLVAEAMCAGSAYSFRPPGGPGERRSQIEIASCGVAYREDRDLITLAVHTGLRWGEISALGSAMSTPTGDCSR